MKQRKLLDFGIIALLMFLQVQSIGQEVPKIRVDPDQAHGGTVSDYFERVEYIPLETTKESTFGAPRKMIITDSSIVILDVDTWSILFFNLSGKYITKQQIPKEVRSKNLDVFLDKSTENDNIIMNIFPIDRGNGEVRIYSALGKLLKIEKRFYINGNVTRKIKLDSSFYALSTLNYIPIKSLPVDSTFPLVQIYNSKNKLHKDIFSLSPQENPFLFAYSGGVTITPNIGKETGYFSIPYDYRFFSIGKDSVKEIGQFVFPTKNIINSKLLQSKDFRFLDSLGQEMAMNLNLVESVPNIDFYKNILFFTLQKKLTILPSSADGSIYDPLNFMYDIKRERLISFERITPDSLSLFLPILDGFSSSSGMNRNGRYLYTSISSLRMFSSKEKTKSKNAQYPDTLNKYFQKEDRKSNPVIVRMKLKE